MPRKETRSKKRTIFITVSIVLIFAIAASVCGFMWNKRHQTPVVQVTTVQLHTMKRVIISSGQVKPTARQLILPTALPGPVKKLDVHVGQTVNQGQTLIELDNTQAQAAVSAAQSAVEEANASYQRALQGYNSAPSILKQIWLPQVTAAQSAVAQAQGQLQSAEASLKATDITANMSGLVLIANPNGIDDSGNQSPIIEVVGTSKEILLDLSEVDATHVKDGMQVSITSDAYPKQTYSGTVSSVAPYAQTTQSGTGVVEVDVKPKGAFPIPYGYQVDCKISSASHNKVTTIPYSALVQEGTNYAVYVVKQNHVHLVTVQLGITNDTSVEVTSGLKVGDTIVDNPPATLADGAAVRTK